MAEQAPAIPDPVAARREAEAVNRRRWGLVLAAVIVVAVGWLYFSPPSVPYGLSEPISCRPLGPGMQKGQMHVGGVPSYSPAAEGKRRYLDSLSVEVNAQVMADAELGIADACADARVNRQTMLNIVLVGGIVTMLGIGLYRQSQILNRLESRTKR